MSRKIYGYVSTIDIGQVIKERVISQRISVVWLARQLGCSRTNVYKIFEKHSVDTEQLMRISQVLNFDFFKPYMEELSPQLRRESTRKKQS